MKIPFNGQSTQKVSCTKKNGSRDSMRLGQLVIAANARGLPVNDLITSERGAYPAARCKENGKMRETDKSALKRIIEEVLKTGIQFSKPVQSLNKNAFLLVDGMSAVHKLQAHTHNENISRIWDISVQNVDHTDEIQWL